MATLVTPEGELTPLLPANGRTFTLAEVQAAVGGYIEIHRLVHDRYLVLNEDGKRLQLPRNPLAETFLYGGVGQGPCGDWVVGPALLCTYRELEGDPDPDI